MDAVSQPRADGMNSAHRSLNLESRIESVEQAENEVLAFARAAGFEEDTQHQIAMAVREIVVNAISHGNAYDLNKHVQVELRLSPESLLIAIQDEGRGFDPGDLPDPLAPENLLRQSGRGLLLARAFMDEVELIPGPHGTEVRMRKRRREANASGHKN